MGLDDFTPDFVDDAMEEGRRKFGEAIDWTGDKTADALDGVGLEGGADWTREKTDSAANALGADVAEWELGQTEDPRKLVHGSVSKLRSTVSHLRDFRSAFDKVGRGLRGLDSSRWKGRTADAFRDRVAVEPKKWFRAADACEKAADAMDRYAETVEWAQKRAKEAIDAYGKAEKTSTDARDAHNAKVADYNLAADTYNAASASGRDPGPAPSKPGDFHDPGDSGRKAAKEKLADARKQRDEAAESAREAVRTARDAAPAKPSYTEQLEDGLVGLRLDAAHVGGGLFKGGAGLLNFVRGLNPTDPYNVAHPAEYLTSLNSTAAGLIGMANNPSAAGKQLLDQFMKDPAEGTGKLIPELVGTKGLGGAKKIATAGKHLPGKPGRGNLDKDGPEQHNKTDGQRTSEGTDPVDLATGKMYLPQTDVSLPGALPLVFTRRVESGYVAGRWFGPSWSSTADQRLEIDAEGVVFISEDGLLLAYPHPAPGLPTLPSTGPRWPLERDPDGDYTLTDPETGHVRHFTGPADGGDGNGDGIALIDQISDRNGHWITFDYDPADHAPTRITHSSGYRLLLTTSDARITALHLAGGSPDGSDLALLRYAYTDGHLTSVTNSSGLPLRFTYDERARVTSWTDTNDRRYDYGYDDRDRCVSEGGEAGHIALRIDYGDPDPGTGHRVTTVTTVTTTEGHTTRYLINDACQVIAQTDPLGHTTRTEYDRFDRPLSRTDALGRTHRYAYDEHGHLTSVTRPDNRTSTAAYNTLGLPTSITGPDGSIWRQEYDEHGNRTAVTDPTGATTRYTHDARGHLATVTDALGNTSHVRCDVAGLPIEVTDPLGAVTRYRRDPFGRVTTLIDPLGGTTRLEWTVEGHLARRTDPDGTAQTWTYDGEGNRTTHTDAVGGVTAYEYTHFDLLAARTGPDGVRYTFTHDAALRLTQVTNPQGLTWTYTYDAAGRLTSETDFDDRTLTYAYDASGHLTSRTNALGETTRYQHDTVGNVIAKTAGDLTTTYEHDPAGRLLQATGPDATLIYHRDRAGRVKSETCNGRTLTFTYDELGRRTRRITPSGATTTWTHDAAGRRTSLTASGHTLTFDHDPAGRETARRIGDGLTLTQAWNPTGQLTAQTLTSASGPDSRTLQSRAYTYRPDGTLTGIDDHLNGPRTFDLDTAGRVTAVHARDWTERYAYDETGNQTHATWPTTQPGGTDSTGPRTYTGTRITGAGSVRYEHDGQGRITLRQKPRLSRRPDTWRYTWDAEDHLTTVTTPDGQLWRYRYDPLGRRIAKQHLADDQETVLEETLFTWDGPALTEQTTGQVTLTWDHSGLHPIAQTERVTDTTTQQEIDQRFFAIVTDLVGTPSELVDETGHIAWRTRTTLWGTTTWPAKSTAYTPLRFPGQYFDPETGLHYNFHRYYDPETARYTTPDPLGLTPAPNPTTYVGNPHTWTDPLGLNPYPTNAGLADHPIHENMNKFYVRAGELVDNRVASHPLTDAQMNGGDVVGHGGVVNLKNEDLIRPGGPQGNDPIGGYRDWSPGDSIHYPGSRIHITGGHHRTAEIVNRILAGKMDPDTLIEFVIAR